MITVIGIEANKPDAPLGPTRNLAEDLDVVDKRKTKDPANFQSLQNHGLPDFLAAFVWAVDI